MTNNYQALSEPQPDFYGMYGTEDYTIPHHHVSEPKRSEWNHIIDLDSFFERVYKYYQGHGFGCILGREICDCGKFAYIGGAFFVLFYLIDYNKFFNPVPGEWYFSALKPLSEVISTLGWHFWLVFGLYVILCIVLLIRKVYNLLMYWDIKQFYNQAMKIQDSELDDLTWSDVQEELLKAQSNFHMCIHRSELTQLDIYHRILRQTNYLVAMVNKKLLPPRLKIGSYECVYLTTGLWFNIRALFFYKPMSLFQDRWHIKDDCKRAAHRDKMAQMLGHKIILFIFINSIASPFIWFGTVMYTGLTYIDQVRREPGKLGLRSWSNYSRYYFRHFNELDHELHARLTRAYAPANLYMNSFSWPLLVIAAEHLYFLSGTTLAITFIFTGYHDVLWQWGGWLSSIAILTVLVQMSSGLIPDESLILDPEELFTQVVNETHYFPGVWQGFSHTKKVKNEFDNHFQYRFTSLLQEVLSPILVPFILAFYVYPRRYEFIDFFRNFTVSVDGVGDVCSFAQMDIRKHGNPEWHKDPENESGDSIPQTSQYNQAEDGKVEISLAHFASTNPKWNPPPESADFVDNLQAEVADLMREDQNVYCLPSSLAMEPSMLSLGIQNSRMRGSYPGNMNYRSSLGLVRTGRKSTFNQTSEGPDLLQSIQNMRASTIILHNRHAMRHSLLLPRQPPEETTPLLFSK